MPEPTTPEPAETPSYPRHVARTRRFSLGAPRAFHVAGDGGRVLFLRSRGGTDPATCLWALDPGTGAETLVADPVALLDGGTEDLPPEERARRERAREAAGGIVAYAVADDGTVSFALSGHAYAVRPGEAPRLLETPSPVVEPRVDPTGRYVAYVHAGALRVVDLTTGDDRALAEPDGENVTYGLAEFVAGEEMNRTRGFWWAPDGSALLAARVDDSTVQRWWIGDPEHPERPATEHAYPAAGTPNADVRLFVLPLAGGTINRTEVGWDRTGFEYVVTAGWRKNTGGTGGDGTGPRPYVLVQTRDQRTTRLLDADLATGATALVQEDRDPDWLEVVPGVPAWSAGRLVRTVEDGDRRRLAVGDEIVSPPGLQVRRVLGADDDGVLVAASDEPTEIHVLRLAPGREPERLTSEPGVHDAVSAGGTTVLLSTTLDDSRTAVTVRRGDGDPVTVASYAETPALVPRVHLLSAGARELRTAVLLPTGHEPGSGKLPVLLDPYGGPHGQMVLASRRMFHESQWFADQGFAVVVADGRGTPGRGTSWERAVRGAALADAVLEDQVDALHAAAEAYPDLDLGRVGIRGWSFGGYLSALAVLRRPDVFHAAVAGAPPTDWALYDTHYTERYLGRPQDEPEAYARAGLLGDAAKLERPLMIIHGLADDNVVAAHSLRLSTALLAAGRPHTMLPLSGVTHMTNREDVAENLLLLQVRFLHDALGGS